MKHKICPYCKNKLLTGNYINHKNTCKKRFSNQPFSNILPDENIPKWLLKIGDDKKLPKKFPIKDILTNSCFYPASEFDASPIIIANDYSHSFIYCDYGISEKDFLEAISVNNNCWFEKGVGFYGYDLFLQKKIDKNEIIPRKQELEKLKKYDLENEIKIITDEKKSNSFAYWTIWKKRDWKIFGAEYFSLLYISSEGTLTYENLYLKHKITPKILSVIQPGYGFGGNWTNFFDTEETFWQVINKGSLPDILLVGKYGDEKSKIDIEYPFHAYNLLSSNKILNKTKRKHHEYSEKYYIEEQFHDINIYKRND